LGKIENLYGESGLSVKNSQDRGYRFRQWSCLSGVFLLLVLTSCSSTAPAPSGAPEIDTKVRAPASKESAGVQVYSLQNPAVKQLTAQAEGAERAGDLDAATGYLERALRIHPQDPQLLQHMAEIKLQKEDYQQALNFAVRSYDTGPRVGEICSRNWRTISVAREHLQDINGSNEAEARATQCMNTRPKGF
jgi:tetratricopeptide (TPR) repeat protein